MTLPTVRKDTPAAPIHRLIYVSAARRPQTAEDLAAILATSRTNNLRDGITGLLIYHDMTFIQMLEGAPADIANCFARISDDPRHGGVSRILDGEVAARSFPQWQMGFAYPEEMEPQARDKVLSIGELRANGSASASDDPGLALLVKSLLGTLRG